MTTIPPECQQEEARVVALKQQHNDLAGQVNATTGAPVWQLLAQLGDVGRRLATAEAELRTCIANPPAVVGEVITIDATASVTMGGSRVTLWELADSGPAQLEQCPVEGQRIAFRSPLPSNAAVTVEADQGDGISGVYLRSGLIEHHTGPLRLEAVLCPEVKITAVELGRWLASLVPLEIPVNAAGIEMTLVVTGLSPALAPEVFGVGIRGSLSGTAFGAPVTGGELTGILRCQVRPDVNPDARQALALARAGGGSELHLSGSLLAMIADQVVSVTRPFVEGRVLDQAQGWLGGALAEGVRQTLMLPVLPPSLLTVRFCHIDETGVIVGPTLGALGNVLSTYDPPPILAL